MTSRSMPIHYGFQNYTLWRGEHPEYDDCKMICDLRTENNPRKNRKFVPPCTRSFVIMESIYKYLCDA